MKNSCTCLSCFILSSSWPSGKIGSWKCRKTALSQVCVSLHILVKSLTAAVHLQGSRKQPASLAHWSVLYFFTSFSLNSFLLELKIKVLMASVPKEPVPSRWLEAEEHLSLLQHLHCIEIHSCTLKHCSVHPCSIPASSWAQVLVVCWSQ